MVMSSNLDTLTKGLAEVEDGKKSNDMFHNGQKFISDPAQKKLISKWCVLLWLYKCRHET
jgi:hypothetical protein